jgi:hypothetical protein
VKHLEGRAEPLNSLGKVTRDRYTGLLGEDWPEAFPPGKDRVAHRAVNRRGNGFRTGNQGLERLVREIRAFLEQ